MSSDLALSELQHEYKTIRSDIENRLVEFRKIWEEGSSEDIFYELMFCLMTPQSKAELCWASVQRIRKRDILKIDKSEDILDDMTGVRFKYKKSNYILEARDKFYRNGVFIIKDLISGFSDVGEMREWLVSDIKGIGLKEAGHFLRNIGFGKTITILDRHILKNLKNFSVIKEVPSSMTSSKYFDIEEKMIAFSKKINIPPDHLDLLFWYREAGKIFK
ncbi:MAG: N-glycosylase/DNA lyase [Candidatus Aminicenantes bacterium]|nr:N-glycosylase/DNA lyase [Candidatus Aminicenantes bacterium]